MIECAWRHGVPARILWLDTDLADAQINAVERLLEAHGSLPTPEELRARGRSDHRYFGPDAQFRYLREMEPPRPDEGFKAIERIAFRRRIREATGNRAVFFDPASVSDAGAQRLRAHQGDGWLLIGLAWNPPGAEKARPTDLEYEYAECPHPAGPPVCWCRKPLPGLVLEQAARHGLDLRECILAGDGAADTTMATRLGMRLLRLEE